MAEGLVSEERRVKVKKDRVGKMERRKPRWREKSAPWRKL